MKKRKLICFSGAGLSADSGLKTFRGGDGLWDGHDLDQICNHFTWKSNFDRVHRFYNDRRASLKDVEPNPAHEMLASWQKRHDAVLITQNVDNLLERAGASEVMHLHGSYEEMLCEACGHIWNIGTRFYDPYSETCPKCPCRKGVKPNVVFFHERAPRYMDMAKVIAGIERHDTLVVIGTDGAVVPIGAYAEALTCTKVLNTLGPVDGADWHKGMVDPETFDYVFYQPAAMAADHLNALIEDLMARPV